MKAETQRHGTVLVVRIDEPRIDAAAAIAFKETMRRATEGTQTRVILDLSRVEFLDSSGLGAVVSIMKQLGEGCRLELAGLAPSVEKVFRLTRMDQIFTIHPELPESGELDRAG